MEKIKYYKTIKYKRINRWKYRGLISDDYDKIHDRYINTTICDLCKIDFNNTQKCMEHCHKTGKFRNIVCNRCNQWKADKAVKNISSFIDKRNGNKRYRITIKRNGKFVLTTKRKTEELAQICLNNFIKENPKWFT